MSDDEFPISFPSGSSCMRLSVSLKLCQLDLAMLQVSASIIAVEPTLGAVIANFPLVCPPSQCWKRHADQLRGESRGNKPAAWIVGFVGWFTVHALALFHDCPNQICKMSCNRDVHSF